MLGATSGTLCAGPGARRCSVVPRCGGVRRCSVVCRCGVVLLTGAVLSCPQVWCCPQVQGCLQVQCCPQVWCHRCSVVCWREEEHTGRGGQNGLDCSQYLGMESDEETSEDWSLGPNSTACGGSLGRSFTVFGFHHFHHPYFIHEGTG